MNKIFMIMLASAPLMLTACNSDGHDGDVGDVGTHGVDCWEAVKGGKTVKDCIPSPDARNPDTKYDFASFCEAFKSLGQYPKGCPSKSHVKPQGDLELIEASDFDDQGKTLSDLSITKESTEQEAYWTFKKGYIRNKLYMAARESSKCEDVCKKDDNCAAAFFTQDTAIGSQGGFCFKVYNSETLDTDLNIRCGIDVAPMKAKDMCLSSLGNSRWWVRPSAQP